MPVLRTHWSHLPTFQRCPDGTIWRLRSFRWNQRRLELEWATDTDPAHAQIPFIEAWSNNISPFGLAGPPDLETAPATSVPFHTGVWANTAPTPSATTAAGAAAPSPAAAEEADYTADPRPPARRRRRRA